MSREERIFLQVIFGAMIGIVLSAVAFILVSTCSINSLCSVANAAPPLAASSETTRHGFNSSSRIPQKDSSDLSAIIVARLPREVEATALHAKNSHSINNSDMLLTHSLSAIPDSIHMPVDGMTVNHLLNESAGNEDVPYEWATRDWMIVTGRHQTFTGAAHDAELTEASGYEILVFFRKSEFRTAIVGYDSAEAASIDLVNIRNTLRNTAQLAELEKFCPHIVNHTEYIECLNID